MDDYRYFLILSSGYCGSLWLGAALDKHPEISCSANRLIGLSLPHDSGFDFSAQDPAIVDAMIRDQSIKSIDDLFERVRLRKRARLAGDVHGYRVATYGNAVASAPHREAVVAHLIRHPVILVERITREYIYRFQSFPRWRRELTTLFPTVCEALAGGLSGIAWDIGEDMRGFGFLFAIRDVVTIFREIAQSPDLTLWAFEHLQADPEVLSRLVSLLSGGAVVASPEFLAAVYNEESLKNSGRYRRTDVTGAVDPAGIFSAWLPQEREAFRRLAAPFDLARLYQRVGYRFDFAA